MRFYAWCLAFFVLTMPPIFLLRSWAEQRIFGFPLWLLWCLLWCVLFALRTAWYLPIWWQARLDAGDDIR